METVLATTGGLPHWAVHQLSDAQISDSLYPSFSPLHDDFDISEFIRTLDQDLADKERKDFSFLEMEGPHILKTLHMMESQDSIGASVRGPPAERKAGTKRSVIPKLTKSALEDFFRVEPYPDKYEVESIARSTGLAIKQVKSWF